MAYKKENVDIVTTVISKEHHRKLNQLVIDLRYKSKSKLMKDILENSIDGIFRSIYGEPQIRKEEVESALKGAFEGMSETDDGENHK